MGLGGTNEGGLGLDSLVSSPVAVSLIVLAGATGAAALGAALLVSVLSSSGVVTVVVLVRLADTIVGLLTISALASRTAVFVSGTLGDDDGLHFLLGSDDDGLGLSEPSLSADDSDLLVTLLARTLLSGLSHLLVKSLSLELKISQELSSGLSESLSLEQKLGELRAVLGSGATELLALEALAPLLAFEALAPILSIATSQVLLAVVLLVLEEVFFFKQDGTDAHHGEGKDDEVSRCLLKTAGCEKSFRIVFNSNQIRRGLNFNLF